MCSLVPTRARYCVLALLSMLLVGSGCCLTPICRTGTGCSSCSESIAATGCDSCGGTCQSGCGNEEVYPGTCGTCVPGNCGGLSGLMLPLLSTRLACGSGCGGVYWNEWVSDPPVCCDPCNDCGCWVGPRCGDCGECGGCGGCGGVLRRGPLAVVGAAWHGVTGIVGHVVHTGLYGYHGTAGVPCGCAECVGGMDAPVGCDACGSDSCGGCAQAGSPDVHPLALEAQGSGVRPVTTESAVASHAVDTRPPHRLVTKRLRR